MAELCPKILNVFSDFPVGAWRSLQTASPRNTDTSCIVGPAGSYAQEAEQLNSSLDLFYSLFFF